MKNCDILIIGAGIAGLSAACELSQFASVTVLERESQPGYHTTGRSAAVYLQSYGNREIRALTLASHSFFKNPPAGFTEHPLLSPRGALFIARADQVDTLAQSFKERQAHGPTVRKVSSEEAIKLNSSLRPDYVAAALYEPDASDIDVHALHNGYRKGLLHNGGDIVLNSKITDISYSDGNWKIITPTQEFSAPVIINAAGAWGDIVAEMADVRPVGLIPKRRTIFTFEPSPEFDTSQWPLTADIDENFYFKPDAGMIMASPADETPSPACDAQPEELDIAMAADHVQKATTLEIRRIANKWAGLRSFVRDKTPVIGMDDEREGFFWLIGQGGYGIQTAPAIAKAVASLILTGALPDEIMATSLTKEDIAPGRLR